LLPTPIGQDIALLSLLSLILLAYLSILKDKGTVFYGNTKTGFQSGTNIRYISYSTSYFLRNIFFVVFGLGQ
jgi:hypothetical protein